MLKKLEMISGIFMLIGFLGTGSIAFVNGFIDGYNGIDNISEPSLIFDSMWRIATLMFFIIKGLGYKSKCSNL